MANIFAPQVDANIQPTQTVVAPTASQGTTQALTTIANAASNFGKVFASQPSGSGGLSAAKQYDIALGNNLRSELQRLGGVNGGTPQVEARVRQYNANFIAQGGTQEDFNAICEGTFGRPL